MTRPLDAAIRAACMAINPACGSICGWPNCECLHPQLSVKAARDVFLADTPENLFAIHHAIESEYGPVAEPVAGAALAALRRLYGGEG